MYLGNKIINCNMASRKDIERKDDTTTTSTTSSTSDTSSSQQHQQRYGQYSNQQAKDNTKELSRIGVNSAKTFEQTSRDNTRQTGTTRVSVETQEEADRSRRF